MLTRLGCDSDDLSRTAMLWSTLKELSSVFAAYARLPAASAGVLGAAVQIAVMLAFGAAKAASAVP